MDKPTKPKRKRKPSVDKTMMDIHKRIDNDIFRCDDVDDSIVLACCYLTAGKRILKNCIGRDNTDVVLLDLLSKDFENET